MPATFGQLIDEIKSNPNITGLEYVLLKINGDKINQSPDRICSWRGSYVKACLISRDNTELISVPEFNRLLNESISIHDGAFDRWERNSYSFFRTTPIWFGHGGQNQDIAVQGLELDSGAVYVVIEDEKYC